MVSKPPASTRQQLTDKDNQMYPDSANANQNFEEEEQVVDQVDDYVASGRIESKSNDSPMRVGKLEIVTEGLEVVDKWNNEKAVSSLLLIRIIL